MIRKKWNEGWLETKPGENPMMEMMGSGEKAAQLLTLPHDAMIHEKRTQNTKNQHQTGFYPGGCYTYTKMFQVPLEWQGQNVEIEFEGVYENGRVYINGDYAGGCPNGYTEFAVCAGDFLKYGEQNIISVIANNSAEENTRWYSGSGIYRNVNLLTGNAVHVARNGLKILTREVEEDLAVAEVEIRLVNCGTRKVKTALVVEICKNSESDCSEINGAVENTLIGRTVVPVTIFGQDEEHIRTRIQVENPALWEPESPNLYICSVKVMEGETCLDSAQEIFGIRTLSLSAKKGLALNGKEVKLRGACVHHDNGIRGAVTLERAEERRVQQMKAAGFNCLRSSHHPMSREMLAACDREGMMVLDELSDCWTRSKNNNDYAQLFSDYWEKDVTALVEKDYNHPCVIMYIAGNEIQEAATAKGAQLNRKIMEKFHSLDGSRYVTVAINGLLSCMDHMGEILCDITGMTMEQMMAMQSQTADPQSDAGVDEANGSTDLMKGPMADAFAANHIVTELLDEFASVTDLTGYNYLTARHEMEHQLNPNRVILGTETLPSDIVRLWDIVKRNPHVIGDMTWTGYDYIGEAGSGSFYYDGRTGFMPNWPISLAEMGDINIIGIRRPVSYFREIVYGLRKEPYIAVERVSHYGEKPNQSAWPWKDEIASWTWDGYEGKGAVINVYSEAEEVELFLNGKSLGRKAAGEAVGFLTSYDTVYEPGELKAVNYRGGETAETALLSSSTGMLHLQAETDRCSLRADGADLAYVMISFADEKGIPNLQTVREVTVKVEGAGYLAGMGSADPATDNSYDSSVWRTYDGYVLAVVRTGTESGNIRVVISADDGEEKEILLTAK